MSNHAVRAQDLLRTQRRRLFLVAGVLLFALALQACGDRDSLGPSGSAVEVWPEIALLLAIGDTIQLTAFLLDETGAKIEDLSVAWSSTDASVAEADGNGRVTARGVGHATIMARTSIGVDSALITVDPLLVTRNYCGGCHRGAGHSSTDFVLTACPACHLMTVEPEDPNHGYISVDHKRASKGYQLVDAHESLLCENCHQLDATAGAPYWAVAGQDDCLGCHREAYDSIHAGTGMPTTCLNCHTQVAWDSVTFNHLAASRGFELLGRHQVIECTSCHDPDSGDPLFKGVKQSDCFACHVDDYERQHGGSGFPTACLNCHTNEGWGVVNFDHAAISGGFALIGAHAPLGCSYCHDVANNHQPFWDPVDQYDCISCHRVHYDAAHLGTGVPLTCADCHSIDGPWANVSFDHAQRSGGFALVGIHSEIACNECHRPDGTPIYNTSDQTNCAFCHQRDYDGQHAGSGIPTACADCHSIDGPWSNVNFDHAQSAAGFALLGRHQQIPCTSCHDPTTFNPLFNPTSHEDCITCHQVDYDFKHAGSGTPTSCLDCHTNSGWGVVDFDHAAVSNGFDLIGAHVPLGCVYCHDPNNNDQVFWNPSDENDCIACHQDDYDSQHSGSGFATDCLQCHTIDSWLNAVFDHNQASEGFALIGVHDQLPCTACHQQNGTPLFVTKDELNCILCHQSDYDSQHSGTGIPASCTDCHTVDGPWADVWFDHGVASDGFDLVGNHTALACTACHDPNNGVPIWLTTDENQCSSCHQALHDSQHSGSGIPTTCGDCHTADGPWANVNFDHAAASGGFDLIGSHTSLACTACHDPDDGAPRWLTNDENRCVACHQPLYDTQHLGTGIPTTCGTCHSTDAWTGAVFDHPTASGGFDLIGTHASLACTACHDPNNGVPIWLTNDENLCIACHQAEYDTQHGGTGYPTSACPVCHTPDGPWTNVSFDHTTASGGFALIGKHEVIACTKCHDPVGGASLFNTQDDNDCYACHRDRFLSAHNSGPTTCEDCHTRNSWTEVTFNHDSQYFPIYTLKHRGKWQSCSDCHTNPNDYSVFTCLNCHAHSRDRMDSDHRGESGYQYTSSRCLDCHPRGIAD